MSEISIFDRIQMGEDSRLELKRVVVRDEKVASPDARSVADELTALANSNSGTVVLSKCRLTDVVQNVKRQTIMDRRGEGVPIIYKEGEKYSLKRPEYRLLSDSELLLTIYAAPADNPIELLKIARNSIEELTDKESRVLGLIKQNASITQMQMADACGVSRATIANVLKRLKTSGRVRREGSDRDGVWVVMERSVGAT